MIAARNCFIKNVTGVLTLSNKNIESVTTGFGFRTYSKEKDTCCKDVVQTEGRQVEPWPKPELYHSFRSACPKEQQPVNYDPYRIKVPEVAVPPFPPSNAKTGLVLTRSDHEMHQNPRPYQGPKQEASQNETTQPEEAKEEGGLMSLLRGLFGRKKEKDKGSSDAMAIGIRNYD